MKWERLCYIDIKYIPAKTLPAKLNVLRQMAIVKSGDFVDDACD